MYEKTMGAEKLKNGKVKGTESVGDDASELSQTSDIEPIEDEEMMDGLEEEEKVPTDWEKRKLMFSDEQVRVSREERALSYLYNFNIF